MLGFKTLNYDINKSNEELILDAKNKSLGRLSVEVVNHCLGKYSHLYSPNSVIKTKINIINFKDIKLDVKKQNRKIYRHTGYIGHVKSITLKEFVKKDPRKAFISILMGMFPKNKTRCTILKNIRIE